MCSYVVHQCSLTIDHALSAINTIVQATVLLLLEKGIKEGGGGGGGGGVVRLGN